MIGAAARLAPSLEARGAPGLLVVLVVEVARLEDNLVAPNREGALVVVVPVEAEPEVAPARREEEVTVLGPVEGGLAAPIPGGLAAPG